MASPPVEFIAKHWYRRSGYLATLVVLFGIEVTVLKSAPILLLGVMVGSVLVFEILWQFLRMLPRTKRGRVGFVISMTSDDEKEAAKIRADLVVTIRRLLKSHPSGATFQVIEVPQHHAEKIVDSEDAQRLRLQTRGHFLLYGRVRVRHVGGKPHHFVELDGVVSHQPIPVEISGALGNEFRELLPRQVLINAEDDLFAFQFTSEVTELVAKYIIGCAAALSRDFDYAERLYIEVLGRVGGIKSDFPAFAKLRERLPKRIAELYEARARLAYERWASTHDPAAVDRLGEYLAHIDPEQYASIHVLQLNAIFAFLKDKNVTEALNWLNGIRMPGRDGLWYLNVAFLLAYDNDLRGAIRHYRRAIEQPLAPDVIGKIEDFVYYVATTEPDRYQLYYCLGFFNWKFKNDVEQAVKDFKAFIEQRQGSDFEREVGLATKWLAELGASL